VIDTDKPRRRCRGAGPGGDIRKMRGAPASG
jgi:hypothetical protein